MRAAKHTAHTRLCTHGVALTSTSPLQSRRPGRQASRRRRASPPQSAQQAAPALQMERPCARQVVLAVEPAGRCTEIGTPARLPTSTTAHTTAALQSIFFPLHPAQAHPCRGQGRRRRAPPAGSATSVPPPPRKSTRPRHRHTAAAPCRAGGRSPQSEGGQEIWTGGGKWVAGRQAGRAAQQQGRAASRGTRAQPAPTSPRYHWPSPSNSSDTCGEQGRDSSATNSNDGHTTLHRTALHCSGRIDQNQQQAG